MLMMIIENGLKSKWAACFIRINNLAERVHQRLLQQQPYCLTKPLIKGIYNPIQVHLQVSSSYLLLLIQNHN